MLEGTFTFNEEDEPLTSVSPPHVDVVLAAPHDDPADAVGVGASRWGCASAQLGAEDATPFCCSAAVDLSDASTVPEASLKSAEAEGVTSAVTG